MLLSPYFQKLIYIINLNKTQNWNEINLSKVIDKLIMSIIYLIPFNKIDNVNS